MLTFSTPPRGGLVSPPVEEEFDFPAPGQAEVLTIAIDGWEGPLDLLLALARTQKVDLKQISILALVDQYIAFINEARALKLELAADYLVMGLARLPQIRFAAAARSGGRAVT